jgi:hypothetical protein
MPGVSAHACDCHAGAAQNRICLFTEPADAQLQDDTFDFDIKIRNYYRGGSVYGLSTFVQSCRTGNGGYCTFSESGDTDFWITVEPADIVSIPSGSGPIFPNPNYEPEECRNLDFGEISTINAKIAVNKASEGKYTVRFRVTWGPHELARYVDVTFRLESEACSDECTSGKKECVGNSQYRVCETDGTCAVWSQPQSCPGGQQCSSGQCVPVVKDSQAIPEGEASGHGVLLLIAVLASLITVVVVLVKRKKLVK